MMVFNPLVFWILPFLLEMAIHPAAAASSEGEHYSCPDPCVLDPIDVFINPLEGLPTNDESLEILVGIKWPIRDVNWLLSAFEHISQADNGTAASKQLIKDTYSPEDYKAIDTFALEASLPEVNTIKQRDTVLEQKAAIKAGMEALENKDKLELKIREANITVEKYSATVTHQLAFSKSSNIAKQIARAGFAVTAATRELKKALKLNKNAITGLKLIGPLQDCDEILGQFQRPKQTSSCDNNSPYRTADGSCNNIFHDLLGSSFRGFRRDLGAHYDNGVDTFRLSVNGDTLPSAREISSKVNNAKNEKSQSFSMLHMTYGQFIDHDLTATPLSRASFAGYAMGESPILCCGVPTDLSHPECASINIPKKDHFYRCFEETCMEFARSAPAEDNCMPGPRQQINQQTAYLDGSVIYGNQESTTNALRSNINGFLKTQLLSDGQMLLPIAQEDQEDPCNTPERENIGQFCFLAGDGRANEQILLTFYQTLWAREHNRVALILRIYHSNWDDERLFQEARRIVVAQLQQVTYAEFLPTIIGPTLMASSRLHPQTGQQQTTDYDPETDATIANSFAAAAYRFGHSLIADNLLFVTKEGETTPQELSTLFFNPFELYRKGAMCEVARGGIKRPGNKMDALFSEEVAGKLFRGSKPFGLDLVAINIQRGRDHGLPPYNSWRVFCGLPKAKSFDDLSDQMSQDRIDALEDAYENVDDIDLYIGGVSENPIPGALLGHTFTCLIHNQFFRLKYGDRYWFEYTDGPGAFTGEQLEQLHRVTLARIMCNNLPELDHVPRWPLRKLGPDNPRVCCKSIRQYSLNPWSSDCNATTDENHQHDNHSD